MSQGYAYTLNAWPSIFTALLLMVLGAYSLRRRTVPGALPFALGCLFAGLWAAGSAPELAAAEPATKVFWVKFQAVWQLPATTAVTCFVLEYTRPGRWLTRRNVALLSFPSLFVLLSIVTDHHHHLFWGDFRIENGVIPIRAPLNWFGVCLGYVFGVINLVVLGWLFVRSPEHRWPVVIILSAQIGARVVYAVDATKVVRSAIPLDVVSLTYLFSAYAAVLFGFGLFNPMPLARRTVMSQMREGVLVLDPQGRVTSLNPAAERILGLPVQAARGRALQSLLPLPPGLDPDSQPVATARADISRGTGPEGRDYTLEISSLEDWRGQAVGSLLILRDVTDEHRAQGQALQTQWAEATLHERELLAQELHDGLVQSLGFLNLQAQAAQVHLHSGEREAADDSLKRLGEVALQVQGDARELIGNLLTVSLPSDGFCTTLGSALRLFEEQTGLSVHLETDAAADGAGGSLELPPAIGVQLLRIVQEALANVRKHAGSPTEVSVTLRVYGGQVMLTIRDNGTGFAPNATRQDDSHFGLQVMRQRAARIGGEITVRSAPGQGTLVEVCVPLGASGNG